MMPGIEELNFLISDAVDEVIKRSRKPPTEIFSALMNITSIGPQEVSDPFEFPPETWEEFATRVSTAILWREIYLDRPEVRHEDDRRAQYWAFRTG